MPWSASDTAKHTHKAKSAKAERQWSHVANSVLQRTGDEGLAIREANGVIGGAGDLSKERSANRAPHRTRRGRYGG